MSEPPKFSRLALAAALLEYDNDPDDKYGDNVDHKKSAIFRNIYNRPPQLSPPRGPDGRPLVAPDPGHGPRRPPGPSVLGGLNGPESPTRMYSSPQEYAPPQPYDPTLHLRAPGAKEAPARLDMSGPYPIVKPSPRSPPQTQRRNSSGDVLDRNSRWMPMPMPAPGPQMPELPAPEAGVDLGSLPDVRHKVATAHARVESMTNQSEKGVVLSRSSNSIHLERLEAEGGLEEVGAEPKEDAEDVFGSPGPAAGAHGRRSSIAALTLADTPDGERPNPVMVPLPGSPATATRSGPSKRPTFDMHFSDFSEEELLRNPFEIPGPSTEFASRFDPKARRSLDLDQVSSRASIVGDIRPQSERRKSLTDFDAEVPPSEYSPRQQTFDDIPHAGEYGRPLRPPKYGGQALRIARHELLRPKTLIMPAPLEGTERPTATVHIPEGFMLGEKPLPADARASILNMGVGVPLSLAQRTFRSSLMVGGRREEDMFFRGQAEEGEIYGHDDMEDDEPMERKPGKLYGTSLIDQLEARKMAMRNKKRVFYGDHRPSMMARNVEPVAEQHDAGDGNAGGGALSPPKASVGARPSTTVGMPTLNVPGAEDDDAAKKERLAKTRSVFGVDTVWEREMAKLKAIQEAEKKATNAADMERLAAEREKIERADRRRTRFLKSKSMMAVDPNTPHIDLPNPNRMSIGIPDLAAGPGEKRITMFGDDNRLSMMPAGDRTSMMPGEDGEHPEPPALKFDNDNPDSPGLGVENWFESSDEDSEDDNVPLSTINPNSVRGSVAGSVRAMSPQATRTQSRLPVSPSAIKVPPPPQLPMIATSDDESSDEDVPLSKVKAAVYDSDEEVPLSKLKKGGAGSAAGDAAPATASATAVPDSGPMTSSTIRLVSKVNDTGDKEGDKLNLLPESSSFGLELQNTLANISASDTKDEDDDDVPLYLRRQKAKEAKKKEQTVEEIEDDLPLAWKHAGAAQKQAAQRTQNVMPNMNPYASMYMSGYGMAGMPMGGMGGMGPMSMMMPNMGPMGMPSNAYPAAEVPDPGSNIDNWRKQVGSLAPAKTGTSGQTVSSRP